jgi:peptide/nickel transport system substrate-binding protein
MISDRGQAHRPFARLPPHAPLTTRRTAIALGALVLLAGMSGPSRAASADQLTWGVHVSLAPTWFDPAEMSGIITPYMVYYALHDALVKPMPGMPFAPSLAESWSLSDDGLTYEFVLRKGSKFHNGEPVTSEDVKYSYERYRGSSNKPLKDHVAAVETPDAGHVRFRLKEPWPDFLTFYANATGAAWIVPRRYVEEVGEEGFKKAPVGAGPYQFVAFTPGSELTMEAFAGYWRKQPSVRRLVFKVIPDEATRLAALKRGEIDIAYSIRGELAEELQHTKGLALKPTIIQAPFWLYFADQWDEKSPWHDPRVRLAASLAIDRATINQALALGHSRITGSIIPDNFEHYWQPPVPKHDPSRAKALLSEAGFAKGFDAGEYYCDVSYSNVAEAVLNNLHAVGIHAKLRPLERVAFFKGYAEKSFKNIIQGGSGAFGNAATRLQAFVVKGGTYVYGSYPDIDTLFEQQAGELDAKKRTALLDKIQELVNERTIYAHIWQLAFLNGAGPRVGKAGLGLIAGHAYSAPYEDVTLAGK